MPEATARRSLLHQFCQHKDFRVISRQQAHVALSFATFANVKSFCIISQCTAHRLQFLFFLKSFALRFRFETYKEFNFVGRRPELSQYSILYISLRNKHSPLDPVRMHFF
jgi:hypothetical protein